MKTAENVREWTRVARFVERGAVDVRPAAKAGRSLLDGGDRGTIGTNSEILKGMSDRGLIHLADGKVYLTAEGGAFLRRQDGGDFLPQHRDIDIQMVPTTSGPQRVEVNLAESPLGQIARRKQRNGEPFLSDREWRAGERLRADYTRGQIMPRLGANWVATVASGRRGVAGGLTDLTDAALAARQRVEHAIEAVGPELQGVLIDVCCFLKGLEQVEIERGWPVRSAKVVLKTALGALARHYEPAGTSKPTRKTLHWGAADYRPALRVDQGLAGRV